MFTSKRSAAKVGIACLLIAALFLSANSPVSPISVTVSAVEFDGDFDSGDFSVWDGTTYDFSWFDPDSDSYVINSAAQFAALGILTNNLSNGFAAWSDALPDNCNVYKEACYDFSDKTITLNVDIDLANNDWLPISYPFDTPNITHNEFDALSHVPAYLTSVDEWVGDGNGNPIITRYLEYPESEMRFRDLLYFAHSDKSVNELVDMSYNGKITSTSPPEYAGWTTSTATFDPNKWMYFANGLQLHSLQYTEEVETVAGGTTAVPVAESYISQYLGDIKIPAYKTSEISADIPLLSYVYQDVHTGGCVNSGFNGTFNGNGRRIKGLHPVTPWTDDTLARLTTFDPIAKGLFGVLDEDGTIENLNIKGYYDEHDVVSYSAFMCAYNYGTIDHCYVDGQMEQGLVTQIYPIARDYGEYSSTGEIITPSEYLLSSVAGTVMPVGNSGFMTAYNKGTISNSFTVGGVTQAFRQFGFFAVINDGIIGTDCINRATFSTQNVQVDFKTDEWDYNAYYFGDNLARRAVSPNKYYWQLNGRETPYLPASSFPLTGARLSSFWANRFENKDLRNSFIAAYSVYNFFGYDAANPELSSYYSVNNAGTAKLEKMQEYADNLGLSPQWGTATFEDWLRVIWSYGTNVSEAYCFYPSGALPGYYQGSTADGLVWIPKLYNTEEGESIAANHLYGIYGMTAVGAICVINNGTIDTVANEADISAILNTSPRYNCELRNTATTYENKSNYNYIRPTNSFGLFATQTNTVSYVAGISVINDGMIKDTKNSGAISEAKDTAYNHYTYITDSLAAILSYTDNKFYRTGCIAQYDEGITNKEFYPLAFQWWWDFLDDTCEGEIRSNLRVSNGTVTARGHSKDIVQIVTRYPEYNWYWSEGTRRRTDTTTGELVTSIHIDQVDNPNYVPLSSNMPYPVYVKYSGSSRLYAADNCADATYDSAAAGITLYNYGTLSDIINEGLATYGICYKSDGLQGTAVIEDVKQLGSGCKENIGYYLLNTSVENGEVRNPVGASYGIARYVKSTNGLSPKLHQISVYEGISGYYSVISDEARIPMSNIFLYDAVHNGDAVAHIATNVDFKDIVNFQESEDGISHSLTNCNLENIWVYNNVVYNGIGKGSIQSYMRNINYFGHSAGEYALGDFTGGEYSDLTANMLDVNGELGQAKYLLKADNATIHNLIAFLKLSDTGLFLTNCNADEIIEYADTIDFGTSKNYYANYVQGTHLSNALLECKINITDIDPMSLNYANVPGVLKAVNDDCYFENVVVQTPSSCISYPSFNFSSRVDRTIRSDAYLDKDSNARATGAMAYWMDHGNTENRTFNYTVATADTMDIMPEEVLAIIEADYTEIDNSNVIALPLYTRRKLENEEAFYRVLIPYMSKGAGEVKGIYTDGLVSGQTECLQVPFPQTSIYVPAGAPFTLRVIEQPGFGLLHLYETSKSVETHEIPFERNTDMQFTMPNEDVTYTSIWTHCYDIYSEPQTGITMTLSASAAVPGETISIETVCTLDDYEVSRVYYAGYYLDADNRWVVSSTIHEISLDDMTFVMPENPVKVFAELASTNCTVTSFVMAGTKGIINNINRTIDVYLNDISVDASNIAPSVFITTAKSISPNWEEPRDFTKPVVFALTCENGDVVEYTVTVSSSKDGEISHFDLLGYEGVINQDEKTITVALPLEMNLKRVTPNIAWRGRSITPSGAIDLTSHTAEYTVVSSMGVSTTYTVTVLLPDLSKIISEFEITDSNGDTIALVVDDAAQTITAYIPYGFDTEGCTISNFRYYGLDASVFVGKEVNLLTLNSVTVTDIDGNTLSYRFIVQEQLATEKRIVQYMLYGIKGIIDEENGIITVYVPSYLDLSNIAPDAVLFVGASITEDYYAAHDWLNDAVSLTVNAYDGSTKVYNIAVQQTEV